MAAVVAEGVGAVVGTVVDVGGDTTTVERMWDVLTITMVVVGTIVDVGGDTTTVERMWDVLTITMVVVNWGAVPDAGKAWVVLAAAAEGVSVGVGISVLNVNRGGAVVGLAPVEPAAAGEAEMSIPNPASASLDVTHPIVTPD
jgi:hypothetical protein